MQSQGLDNYVFFFDNASIHKAKIWERLRAYLNICFNAPYSPFLNPIEELFALWKFYYRRFNTEGNKDDVIKNIIKASHMIEKRQAIGFVKHAIEFYQDCLEEKEIY